MWLLAPIAVAALWFLAVLLNFIPPPSPKILIVFHSGKLHITRGQLRAQSREFVTDILQQANVAKGFIAITHSKRAAFSRSIPRDVQQRLRNVLLNEP
jgi:hypothetical protein